MKNFQKFKGSSRKILFESSIYMHPFFIYSYCESNRNTIDRKYRYSIRNELISFHACLEKKKFTNWNILVQCGKFHPSNLFSFDFYIYLYIIFPKRSESKYQSKFFHTSYNHPPWILFSLFFFEFFFSFFLFLYHHPDRVPLSSMTDCALLKDTPFLPPKKIPPDEVAL